MLPDLVEASQNQLNLSPANMPLRHFSRNELFQTIKDLASGILLPGLLSCSFGLRAHLVELCSDPFLARPRISDMAVQLAVYFDHWLQFCFRRLVLPLFERTDHPLPDAAPLAPLPAVAGRAVVAAAFADGEFAPFE